MNKTAKEEVKQSVHEKNQAVNAIKQQRKKIDKEQDEQVVMMKVQQVTVVSIQRQVKHHCVYFEQAFQSNIIAAYYATFQVKIQYSKSRNLHVELPR